MSDERWGKVMDALPMFFHEPSDEKSPRGLLTELREEFERIHDPTRWTDEERKEFLYEATKASYAEGTRAGCEELAIAASEMSDRIELLERTGKEVTKAWFTTKRVPEDLDRVIDAFHGALNGR